MPAPPFVVRSLSVPRDARRDEQLGTKAKFWFKTQGDQGRPSLFKQGRVNEDWSEKAAAECAGLLGLPHAEIELAECDGTAGTVSPSFLAHEDELVHGNEVLLELDTTYPGGPSFYHVAEHTLDRVFTSLTALGVGLPSSMPVESVPSDFDACDLFTGYLLLDAWIGNSDRHHQNWAIIRRPGGQFLAPTYDHASSLGRNETAERASVRLLGRDPRVTVATYAQKCRSALYAARGDSRPMSTIDAFRSATRLRPIAAAFWVDRLRGLDGAQIDDLFGRFPANRPSHPYGHFAVALLACNRDRILGISRE